MKIRRTDVGEKRPRHPEGTLGIELRAHTLSMYPIDAQPLSEAQFLTGSASRSATRQVRKMVLISNYNGAVRAVTEPSGCVNFAYEANDGRIYCAESVFAVAKANVMFDEGAAAKVIKGTLEACLLDEAGLIDPVADVAQSFVLAVVAVNGMLATGAPLAFHEVRFAALYHEPKIRLWGCDKPVRSVRS